MGGIAAVMRSKKAIYTLLMINNCNEKQQKASRAIFPEIYFILSRSLTLQEDSRIDERSQICFSSKQKKELVCFRNLKWILKDITLHPCPSIQTILLSRSSKDM
jgi:hypothetical protein